MSSIVSDPPTIVNGQPKHRYGGPPLLAGQLTECQRGHPFDDANTGHDGRGKRYCRACTRMRSRKHYRANNPPTKRQWQIVLEALETGPQKLADLARLLYGPHYAELIGWQWATHGHLRRLRKRGHRIERCAHLTYHLLRDGEENANGRA